MSICQLIVDCGDPEALTRRLVGAGDGNPLFKRHQGGAGARRADMTTRYGPEKHHRRSIRLKGFDYSRPGVYFVTVCTQDRACVFGDVVAGNIRRNAAGRMIDKWWLELNRGFPNAKTDEYAIMPNHFHGIVFITETSDGGRGGPMCPPVLTSSAPMCAPLSRIVQWFKTMTTNEYIRGVKTAGWPAFSGRLWQRNYYEHVVRTDASLNRIREYIRNNPAKWESDRENPMARG